MVLESPEAITQNRLVDRFVLHGEPLSFRELCERALPRTTRYLVLDLDRTVHLGHNLGELLGWDIGAYYAYGPETLERMEARRRRSRWVFDWDQPRQLARYLVDGAKVWAYPGTYYLLWGKAASRVDWLRRRAFHQFSGEPVRAAQRKPQRALLRQVQAAPDDVLRTLAEGVWQRHLPDQVITREDLEWVRTHCPDVEIVLASASPRPMVEVAAAALGVDHAHYSTINRINSGEAKIERLRDLGVDFDDPAIEVVGMSDTGYGEDHCWAQYFTHVIDINSTAPYPAIVSASSPLREVHSATVLTRDELRRRAAGFPRYLDSRRDPEVVRARRDLGREDLETVLGSVLHSMDTIARSAETMAKAEVAYRLTVLRELSRAMLTRQQPA